LQFVLAGATIFGIWAGVAHAQVTKTYDVWIKTGTVSGAGTDAIVNITLYGTRLAKGAMSTTDLDISGYDDFENGDADYYKVSFTEDIGEVTNIKLEHDDSSPGSGWFVDQVAVRAPGEEKWVYFTLNRWLATDEGDRLTHVTVRRDDYKEWKEDLPNQITTPTGSWVLACSGAQNCSSQIEESLSIGNSEKHTFSNEVSESLSVEVSSKIASKSTFSSVESGLKVTGTVAGKHINASELVKNQTDGHKESCGFTTDLTNFNIHSVWQWSVSTAYQGTSVVARTCQVACTPNGNPPGYDAGDPRNIGSCLLPRTYSSTPNAGIPGNNTEILSTISLTNCMAECTARTWCKSIDYERGPGKCYLQDVTAEEVALKHDYPGNPYDHYTRGPNAN